MRLWTIQPFIVLDILEQYGVFTAREDLIAFPEFTTEYDWLCEHLEQKDKRPASVKYPVWAWHTFNGHHKKPDLRYNGHGQRGEKLACIELEIPDSKVLLSDFDLWHFVLNDYWIDPDVFLPDYNDEQSDANDEKYNSLSAEQQQQVKLSSWETIFDVEQVMQSDWISRGKYIQAVFWELKMDYVKKVQIFTAK